MVMHEDQVLPMMFLSFNLLINLITVEGFAKCIYYGFREIAC